jgi:hypothetical protein
MGCKHVNRTARICYHCLISYAFKWEVKLILKMVDLFIQCLKMFGHVKSKIIIFFIIKF